MFRSLKELFLIQQTIILISENYFRFGKVSCTPTHFLSFNRQRFWVPKNYKTIYRNVSVCMYTRVYTSGVKRKQKVFTFVYFIREDTE